MFSILVNMKSIYSGLFSASVNVTLLFSTFLKTHTLPTIVCPCLLLVGHLDTGKTFMSHLTHQHMFSIVVNMKSIYSGLFSASVNVTLLFSTFLKTHTLPTIVCPCLLLVGHLDTGKTFMSHLTHQHMFSILVNMKSIYSGLCSASVNVTLLFSTFLKTHTLPTIVCPCLLLVGHLDTGKTFLSHLTHQHMFSILVNMKSIYSGLCSASVNVTLLFSTFLKTHTLPTIVCPCLLLVGHLDTGKTFLSHLTHQHMFSILVNMKSIYSGLCSASVNVTLLFSTFLKTHTLPTIVCPCLLLVGHLYTGKTFMSHLTHQHMFSILVNMKSIYSGLFSASVNVTLLFSTFLKTHTLPTIVCPCLLLVGHLDTGKTFLSHLTHQHMFSILVNMKSIYSGLFSASVNVTLLFSTFLKTHTLPTIVCPCLLLVGHLDTGKTFMSHLAHQHMFSILVNMKSIYSGLFSASVNVTLLFSTFLKTQSLPTIVCPCLLLVGHLDTGKTFLSHLTHQHMFSILVNMKSIYSGLFSASVNVTLLFSTFLKTHILPTIVCPCLLLVGHLDTGKTFLSHLTHQHMFSILVNMKSIYSGLFSASVNVTLLLSTFLKTQSLPTIVCPCLLLVGHLDTGKTFLSHLTHQHMFSILVNMKSIYSGLFSASVTVTLLFSTFLKTHTLPTIVCPCLLLVGHLETGKTFLSHLTHQHMFSILVNMKSIYSGLFSASVNVTLLFSTFLKTHTLPTIVCPCLLLVGYLDTGKTFLSHLTHQHLFSILVNMKSIYSGLFSASVNVTLLFSTFLKTHILSTIVCPCLLLVGHLDTGKTFLSHLTHQHMFSILVNMKSIYSGLFSASVNVTLLFSTFLKTHILSTIVCPCLLLVGYLDTGKTFLSHLTHQHMFSILVNMKSIYSGLFSASVNVTLLFSTFLKTHILSTIVCPCLLLVGHLDTGKTFLSHLTHQHMFSILVNMKSIYSGLFSASVNVTLLFSTFLKTHTLPTIVCPCLLLVGHLDTGKTFLSHLAHQHMFSILVNMKSIYSGLFSASVNVTLLFSTFLKTHTLPTIVCPCLLLVGHLDTGKTFLSHLTHQHMFSILVNIKSIYSGLFSASVNVTLLFSTFLKTHILPTIVCPCLLLVGHLDTGKTFLSHLTHQHMFSILVNMKSIYSGLFSASVNVTLLLSTFLKTQSLPTIVCPCLLLVGHLDTGKTFLSHLTHKHMFSILVNMKSIYSGLFSASVNVTLLLSTFVKTQSLPTIVCPCLLLVGHLDTGKTFLSHLTHQHMFSILVNMKSIYSGLFSASVNVTLLFSTFL